MAEAGMLELVLMRHAEAVPDRGIPDIERPLTPQGRADSGAVAAALAARGFMPELVLASTAIRARTTAHEVLAAWAAAAPPLVLTPNLYLAPTEGLLAALAGRPERRILVIAHNPGIADCTAALTGQHLAFPPGAAAWLAPKVGRWEELYGPIESELRGLFRP